MKILHKYLTRELLISFLLALVVFTFVLMAGRILPEFLRLLSQRVPPLHLLRYFGLLVPFLLTFSIPMALLTSTLLVFGRMSADNEITAMRASGISLLNLIAPAVLFSLGLVLLCVGINCYIAPWCKFASKTLLLEAGLRDPTALVEEGQYTRLFPGYVIHAEQRRTNTLLRLNVYILDENGVVTQNLRADRAELTTDPAGRRLLMTLYQVRGEVRDPKDPDNLAKIRAGIRAEVYPLAFDVGRLLDQARARRDYGDLTMGELLGAIHELRQRGITPAPLWLEAHKRVAGAFACFAFLLIGIPLGIQTQRRETSIGVFLSLALVFAYYFFFIVAKTLENKPQYYPEVILWSPNILFEVIGLVLLWRVARA